MNKLHALLVSLVLLVAPSLADAKREPPLTEEELSVVQVYEAPGFTADAIHAGAKRWIAESFRSAEAVIEYEDKGTIIGNGNITIDPPMERGVSYYSVYRGRVGFKMKVEAKDSRLRVSFTNVRLLFRGALGNDIVPQRRGDMDNIRARLLEFGPKIVASLDKAKTDEW